MLSVNRKAPYPPPICSWGSPLYVENELLVPTQLSTICMNEAPGCWLNTARFLAWTLPEEGVPDHYKSGLYLYGLAGDKIPIHIDGITFYQTEPYGVSQHIVVLEPRP